MRRRKVACCALAELRAATVKSQTVRKVAETRLGGCKTVAAPQAEATEKALNVNGRDTHRICAHLEHAACMQSCLPGYTSEPDMHEDKASPRLG